MDIQLECLPCFVKQTLSVLNMVNASGSAAEVGITSATHQTFNVSKAMVFTGLTGKATADVTGAISDARGGNLTLTTGDFILNSGNALVLFTTDTSGGLFGAELSITGGGINGVDAIQSIATLGADYSYEDGDIVLM